MTMTTSRRGFLKGAATAAAALYVGAGTNGAMAAGSEPAQLNPFVRIDADGTVFLVGTRVSVLS